MKRLKFEFPISRIQETVALTTAYTGVKNSISSEKPENYDGVATVDEDDVLINRFIMEACAALTERLKNFSVITDFSGDSLKWELEVSDSHDPGTEHAAAASMESYIVAEVNLRWMRIAFPEKSGDWEKEASRFMTLIERNLYHRRRPERKPTRTTQDEE